MTLRKALLAATVLAVPMAAQAQPVSGLYVGAGAGVNFLHDVEDGGVKIIAKQPGIVGLGAIGYGFGNGLRFELEGNYRTNDIDKIKVNGARVSGSTGYFEQYGAMGNLLFDIDLGLPFTPYVGVGAGYAWTDLRKARLTSGTSTYRYDNDAEGAFAYQGILGAAYNLGAMVPGLALTAEYRFFGTLEPDLAFTRVSGPGATGLGFKPNTYSHSGLVGLRYAFNAPVAPAPVATPAPVAPPAVARTYLVFFDWNKADLTERARQIITEAAGAARRTSTTRIEVAGHADRSGTPQYNQRLSERRAQAVAAELVRQGVSRNDIAISAFGESRPLVPTADGVREPQNRRVEIVLR